MKIAGNIVGWLGAAVLVGAYGGLTADRFDMTAFHALISIGSVLVGISAAVLRNWPTVAAQVFFVGIAAWGIEHPRPILAVPAALIEITMIEPPVVVVVGKPKVKPKAKEPMHFSCVDVRQAVAVYGAALVEQEARRRGVSEADITRVKTICI